MNKSLASPLLALSLLVPLALPLQAHPLQDGETRGNGLIQFQASASQLLPNDELQATLYTERTEKDMAQLARALNRDLNEALRVAKGVSAVKVATGGPSSWPIYDKQNRLTGWRGRSDLVITSRDFKAASELIGGLQDKLTLQGVQFGVAEETRQTLEQELTTRAVAAFRQKADTLAKAWGQPGYSLVRLQVDREGDSMPRPPMVMMKSAMVMADAAMPAPEMAGGESRLSVRVDGTIRLQP